MKTSAKPRGRKPAPRPQNDLLALLLAEFGPDIEKFFHRDHQELSLVRRAAAGDGYPALSAEWEKGARAKMRNVPNVDGCIAEIRSQHDAKRAAWEGLMIERWQAGDAEFFEMLAVVRRGGIDEMGRLKRAAMLYMRIARESGLTPCGSSFLNWLRKTENADVVNASRADGSMYPVIHRETAKRALAWAQGETES